MLISMTGFGRSQPKGLLTVEIVSVNRKYLEVVVALPKGLSSFEYEVRKWVGEKVSRGQVSVKVQWAVGASSAVPNVKMLQILKREWEKVAQTIGVDRKQITLSFLLQVLPEQGAVKGAEKELSRSVQEALEALLQMKQEEGSALERDIAGRLKQLERSVDAVEKLVPASIEKARLALAEKVRGLIDAKEILLLAEKGDVTEELVRMRSHLRQMQTMLKQTEAAGRKMEFLAQEMHREINTIGSKALDVRISHLVVEMKSELEKIKEQIQNVE